MGEINHDLVIQTIAGLRKSAVFSTMDPRQFVEADLDRLAADGVFPEDGLLESFRKGMEYHVLPVLGHDRAVFEQVVETNFEIFSEAFENASDRYGFRLLGTENVLFFAYCVCMILRNGVGSNPYFGLSEREEGALGAAFRHLVDDSPVTAGGAPEPFAPADIRARLRCR